MLHIDIFSTDRKYFLTCIDKFSKFAMVQPILSRTIEDLKPALLQLLNVFPKAKVIYCDNEPSLNSHTILTMLENHFGVSVSNAPPLHSVSNGQVERFHSTLVELARCLKIDKGISDTVELILLATTKYNKFIHSVIGKRPADVVVTQSNDQQCDIEGRIRHTQDKLRSGENASRQNRRFNAGDKVLVNSNRRLGNKFSPLCEEKTVEADMGTTVLIKGRMVHKDNLRLAKHNHVIARLTIFHFSLLLSLATWRKLFITIIFNHTACSVLWWLVNPSLTNNTVYPIYRFTIIPLLFFLSVASAHKTDFSKAKYIPTAVSEAAKYLGI